MFAVNKSSLALLKSLVGQFIHGRTELLFCFTHFVIAFTLYQNAGYIILLSIMAMLNLQTKLYLKTPAL